MCRGVAATLVALIGAQVTAARPIQKAVVVQQAGAYKGDVTDVRVVRRVESHSDAWRLWQPFIAQWKRKHLVVAFGAMTNGKKDVRRDDQRQEGRGRYLRKRFQERR